MDLHVIVHHRGPTWRAGVSLFEQEDVGLHIGFMRSLEERGLMVLGGPFLDEDDRPDGIVGMAIVRAADLPAAEALAAEDPSIAAGLIVARVRPWKAAMGDAVDR